MLNILVDRLYHPQLPLLSAEGPDSLRWVPVDFKDGDPAVMRELPHADALIGRVNPSEKQYCLASRLKLIQTLSAGFEEVDLDCARRHGVAVSNNNGANAVSVAEHVILLILALYRQLLFHHHSVAVGPWENRKMQNRELEGACLGLIGLGAVGAMVARKATALGMKVQYFDVVRKPEAEVELNARYLYPAELLSTSDVVSYHVPITNYTRRIINRHSLGLMKPDALLINVARGGLQDEVALHDALVSGKISGAGLDVFEEEPLPVHSPLRTLKNVVLTPHSAPTSESYPRAVRHAVSNLLLLQRGEPLRGLAQDHNELAREFHARHPEVDLMLEQ